MCNHETDLPAITDFEPELRPAAQALLEALHAVDRERRARSARARAERALGAALLHLGDGDPARELAGVAHVVDGHMLDLADCDPDDESTEMLNHLIHADRELKLSRTSEVQKDEEQ